MFFFLLIKKEKKNVLIALLYCYFASDSTLDLSYVSINRYLSHSSEGWCSCLIALQDKVLGEMPVV